MVPVGPWRVLADFLESGVFGVMCVVVCVAVRVACCVLGIFVLPYPSKGEATVAVRSFVRTCVRDVLACEPSIWVVDEDNVCAASPMLSVWSGTPGYRRDCCTAE